MHLPLASLSLMNPASFQLQFLYQEQKHRNMICDFDVINPIENH